METRSEGMTRRSMLRTLGIVALGSAAGGLAGCAPLRVATRWAPAGYAHDGGRVDAALAMFAATIVPGADAEPSDAARILLDDAYPFRSYARTFAADLDSRTRRLSGPPAFTQADAASREAVVADGLRADAATRRLYAGAIFMVQVSFYAGLYTDDGCPLIGFDGRFRGIDRRTHTHPHPERFRAAYATTDGNPT
jgi:hypothetical protein